MKPHIHAQIDKKKFGGKIEDYMFIHNFMDSSKISYADLRHRAILHSSFGVYLAEQMFGDTFKNSDNKIVSVREIAERHVLQDLGMIPTLEQWLGNIPIQGWMIGGKLKRAKIKKRVISYET